MTDKKQSDLPVELDEEVEGPAPEVKEKVSRPQRRKAEEKPGELPLDDLVQVTVTPQRLAEELARHGVKTKEDVSTKRQAVIGAFMAAFNPDLQAFLRAAHEYKE